MPDSITEEQAHKIARSVADSKGWGWDESTSSAWRSKHETASFAWYVTTNPDDWGESVHVVLDAETGDLLATSHRPPLRNPIAMERALSIARDYAEKQGWPWSQRFEVIQDEFDYGDRRCNAWSVCTNTDRMGGNVDISIDAETGDVLEGMFINR